MKLRVQRHFWKIQWRGNRIGCLLKISKGTEGGRISDRCDSERDKFESSTVRASIEEAEQVKMLVYSDWNRFGGDSPENLEICTLKNGVLNCTLNPFSAVLLEIK